MLEVVLALAILASVLAGFLVNRNNNIKNTFAAKRLMIATSLAREKMESIKLNPKMADLGGEGIFEEYPGYTWTFQVDTFTREQIGEFKKIRLLLTYPGIKDDTETIEIISYLE
ncbi:MAG: hypothetical protein KAI63_00770 [Planctomycetes bacterium]|nr:hypothetical protein [Planctomycetota bacterium]